MRLTIVRQDYQPEGSVERVTEGALEALLERNVAVSLYTRAWPGTRLQLVEPLVLDPFYIGALWRDWGFARAACRDVRRSQPDLVESHERMLCCDIYRATDGVHASWLDEQLKGAGSMARIAAQLSPHSRYLLDMEKRLYASTWLRAVICNSRMVKEEIRRYYAVPESKLHVIYNPVDSAIFHPGLREARAAVLARHGIAADVPVFLVAAADPSRADVGSAVDAFAQSEAGAHLFVLLGGKTPARFVARARAAGVAGRVTFVDGDTDRRQYFGAADVFVTAARYDPSPTTPFEAMACGLPVIASSRSGVAELLPDCDAGFVYPAGDVDALKAHMQTMLDPRLRARLSANARRSVASYSPSAITLQQVLLYRDLLASPSAGPAVAASTADPIHGLPLDNR